MARVKGSLNSKSIELKTMIQGALNDAGGREYLVQQARENPTAFLTLVGKIIPRDYNLGGQEDNPIAFQTSSDDEIIKRFMERTNVK